MTRSGQAISRLAWLRTVPALSSAQFGSGQVAVQIGVSQSDQHKSAQVSLVQVSPAQVGSAQVRPAQVVSAQELKLVQVRSG